MGFADGSVSIGSTSTINPTLILVNVTDPFAPPVVTLNLSGNYTHQFFALSTDAASTGSYLTVHPLT
jgi:hypothetical protein